MDTSYQKWLALQDGWTRKLDANAKQILYRYLAAIPILSMAALVLVGLAARPEAVPALDSLKKGGALGAVLDLVCVLVLVPTLPGRRCRRQLRRTVNRLLDTESKREVFALQLLGCAGSAACCVSWTDKATDENRVWVTRDYVVKISGTGRFQLVCLKEAEQMEPDSRLRTWVLGRRDLKLLCRRRTYIIRFYGDPAHRRTAQWRGRLRGSSQITFPSQQTRDQVMKAVRSMNGRF